MAEVAGRNLKKVVLELGGSDPFMVLGVSDLTPVIEAAIEGRMENSGQACNASKRYIVLDEQYDEFVEKVSAAISALRIAEEGDNAELVGPLSSQQAADGLRKQAGAAIAEGARGHRRRGRIRG